MRKEKVVKDNSERWLLTYSDLITLLMVLFVILYASSNIDKDKYKEVATSFREALYTENSSEVSIYDNTSSDSGEDDLSDEEKLEKVQNNIEETIEKLGLDKNVTSVMEEGGILISINDSLLFDSGEADLKDQYKTELFKIAEALKQVPNDIQVKGYTDNVPIKSSKYNSNWQLSSIRAANVVEFLMNSCGISGERLSAAAYGEYSPAKDNSTSEGRAFNRRVNILVLKDTLD